MLYATRPVGWLKQVGRLLPQCQECRCKQAIQKLELVYVLVCQSKLFTRMPFQLTPICCCAVLQVDEAYLRFGPAHDIVSFMQSLGYKDFRTARQGEEKMEQFKRALKLTRPAFAATRSPMQQVPGSH